MRWALVLPIAAAIGCTPATRPPARKPPRTVRPEMPEHVIDGPPCGPGGPIVDTTVTRMVPGKPPHRTTFVDARVRNPAATPVWFLYDLDGPFLSVVNEVTLSRTSAAPYAYVWSFLGDGGFEAVRVPPGADLMLRGLELSTYAFDDHRLLLAFASALDLGGRAAEAWVGQAGLSPARGDFEVDRPVPVVERQVDGLAAVPLGAHVLCVRRVD